MYLSIDGIVWLIIFGFLIEIDFIGKLLKSLIGNEIEVNADNIENKTGHFVDLFFIFLRVRGLIFV